MNQTDAYICIAVVDWQSNGTAIETISISEGKSSFSGAWYIEKEQMDQISLIVSRCLLIEIGSKSVKEIRFDETVQRVDLTDFLKFAKLESGKALEEYQRYKDLDPIKRKDLVEPSLTNWPENLNLNQASIELEKLGKAASINGTDPEMETVLTASRLVKWLVDSWLNDEQERVQRLYMTFAQLGVRVVPDPWWQKWLVSGSK